MIQLIDRFTEEERLNKNQIKSFFSNLSSNLKKKLLLENEMVDLNENQADSVDAYDDLNLKTRKRLKKTIKDNFSDDDN